MDDPTGASDEESSVGTENEGETEIDPDAETEANGITARYLETETERRLEFDREGASAVIAQNREGYAMVAVRKRPSNEHEERERERYYGFDMALDHAAELLGVSPHDLPIPERAADMGM